MKIKLINQIIETQESFGYTINTFYMDSNFEIVSILKANLLDLEIQPNFVKESIINEGDSYGGYLRGLFYSDKLSSDDFQFIRGEGIYYYLEGFSDSEEEWGTDKPIFKSLLNSFREKTKANLNDCYLINKEWFYNDKSKVREREFTLYTVYLIIVWLDTTDNSKFYIAEWCSD